MRLLTLRRATYPSLLLLVFGFFLSGCQSIPIQGLLSATWRDPIRLTWSLWSLLALAALTFLLGLRREYDSLSIVGLCLAGVALCFFFLGLVPAHLRGASWISFLLCLVVFLGALVVALLLLMRSLEDGSRWSGILGFLLIFFTTLPYTQARQAPLGAPTLPPSVKHACFGQAPQPSRALTEDEALCTRLARLHEQVAYKLHHSLYPLLQDYQHRFEESLPALKLGFAKLPPEDRTLARLPQSRLLYDWRRMNQIALYLQQIRKNIDAAEIALAQSRFFTWEIAQTIRIPQRAPKQQKPHYKETERHLLQIIDAPPFQADDSEAAQQTQEKLLRTLLRSLAPPASRPASQRAIP
jgi:hypothetical protein